MRKLVICGFLFLFLLSPAYSADLEQQVKDIQVRIQQLENDLSELQDELQEFRNQLSSTPPRPSGDPLVGRWDCTNNLYNYEIYFSSNGRMVQQEAVLGSTKVNYWTRVDKDQIALSDGLQARTKFESEDEFSVSNVATNSTWYCTRISE